VVVSRFDGDGDGAAEESFLPTAAPAASPGPAAHRAAAADPSQAADKRLLYMYGAVTLSELNTFLDAESIDTDEQKHEIKARWREAAERFQRLTEAEAGIPDTVATRPLPPEAADYITQLQKNPALANTFSNFPRTFELVEIDKVVAGQRTVHLDFVEHLKATYVHSTENLLRRCLDPEQDPTPVSVGRTGPKFFTVSSPNRKLRFLGVYERPYRADAMGLRAGGQPVHAVMLLVGYGTETVNMYRIGKRLVLSNGFHRLNALRALGITYAPALIQHVTQPDIELPAAIQDLPRDYLIKNPRPGLMKDFFDPRLTCEIRQRSFLKVVQIGWGVNESKVPR
jgi:hypothetical protein